MQDDPPEDDDIFCEENPEEDSLLDDPPEDTIADYDFKFDEALSKLYGGNYKTYWISRTFDKCLFAFAIILLLSLIPMILYAYVCWINSMMP